MFHLSVTFVTTAVKNTLGYNLCSEYMPEIALQKLSVNTLLVIFFKN